MATTHIVQFQNPGPRGGEYNVPVTAEPGATDEQVVNQAIAKANRLLARLNRLGNDLSASPAVHLLGGEASR